MMERILVSSLLVALVTADIYLHNPRGSNNRLNEKSANRANGNRAFDSQNNNRGGYNVGDATSKPAGNDEGKHYRMSYFQSGGGGGGGETELIVEWTSQHGCGGNEDADPHKQNCNMVLQYMCQPNVQSATGTQAEDILRDGVQTNTPDYTNPGKNENENARNTRRTRNQNLNRVLQEPWAWYDSCNIRERNKGLFTADQKLKSNNGLGYSSAIYTRQNPAGTRRGYECPEERDYFPYWHPTPWKDIVVLAENQTMCTHYQKKSFNVQPYHECLEYWDASKTRKASKWNNAAECAQGGGEWTLLYNYLEKAPGYTTKTACESQTSDTVRYMWEVPYDTTSGSQKECLIALPEPDCMEAPWSRSNHLGNGREGTTNNYTWVLPHFPSGDAMRCVMRLRYNISTDDYDPYTTDSKQNANEKTGVRSPVEQNPDVKVGPGFTPLRLAINTAQFGRTFQDRTHVFLMKSRPAGTGAARIVNLNVRGKRGNIVQTYPAVEYDFVPNDLHIREEDLVHIQWTGSNTHNNGGPAGDGQAGDDGEGTRGTDRNNIVQTLAQDENFPTPFEHTTLWKASTVKWIYHEKTDIKPEDLALSVASSGYYRCLKKASCPEDKHNTYIGETKTAMNNLLNNAPASYEGVLLKVKKGTYHYICTRNNNFTNRSQKGKITVT